MKTFGQSQKVGGCKVGTAGGKVTKSTLIVILAAVLAFSCTGCGGILTSTPQVDVPTGESRFISLEGTDLPDQELPPEPEPPQNPLTALQNPEPELVITYEEVDGVVVEVITEVPPVDYTPINCEEVPCAPAPSSPQSNPVVDVISGIVSSSQSATEAAPVDYSFEEETTNTEEYALPDELGFFDTKTNPLSTFSADVDTASYSNLRRIVNQGGVLSEIPAGAVRIEEMLNYFSYDFIMPDEGKPFALNAQVADCPWNPDSRLMILGLQAQGLRDDHLGSNLVFLIDISGSMDAPDKMELLKPAFCFLVDQLTEFDTISIVTYASGVNTVLSGANGSEKERIKDAVNNLRSGGGTNGSDGLQRAYEIAEANFIEGGNNRIIMASDGDLNVGITSTQDLYDYVSYMRYTGVYLSVLGFGFGNYKDEKMETLADNGNGNYHYIDTMDEAKKVLGTDLMANIVSVADDVKLQVEFNPDVIKSYRLIGYENRRLNDEDFLDDTKDAAEMGAGHQVIVAYEIIMVDSATALEDDELAEESLENANEADEAEGEQGSNSTDAALQDDETAQVAALEEAVENDAVEEDEAIEDVIEEDVAELEDEGIDEDEAIEDAVDATDENTQWCTVALRYKIPGEPVSKGIEFVIDDRVYTDDPDKDWVFISGVIEAGLILSQSSFTGTASLEEALVRVKAANRASNNTDQYRKEFVEILTKLINS